MPTYNYTVRDEKGKIRYGSMDADDTESVRVVLQKQGFWVINISQGSAKKLSIIKSRGRTKVNTDDLIMFAEQMAAMIESDVSIIKTLEIFAEQTQSKLFSSTIRNVAADVKAGSSFPQAMKKHPQVFSDLWIYLLEAGEASGETPAILRQLASYLEMRRDLESRLLTALLYPIILICLAIAIIIIFIFRIVPIFQSMFSSFGMSLPLITQLVISASNFVKNIFWYSVVVITGLGFGLHLYLKTETGKFNFDSFILKIPLIGKFIYNILIERFTSNLSIMLKSAVPILTSIDTIEKIFSSNKPFHSAITNLKNDVRQGKTLSYSLGRSKLFPTMLVQMTTIGEEVGRIPQMLDKVAKYYKSQLERFIARFTALIEPVIIIVVGAIVAVVVFSIFLPIFKMASIGGIQ